jgi:hypothetical protein
MNQFKKMWFVFPPFNIFLNQTLDLCQENKNPSNVGL